MSLTLTLTATSAYDLREQILALAAEYAPAADPVIQPAPTAKAKPAPIKAAGILKPARTLLAPHTICTGSTSSASFSS